MLKSMTAFSRKESVSDWGTLVWEMRSVNHRYLDVSIRMADELRLIEPQVREKINARLSRGKVEVSQHGMCKVCIRSFYQQTVGVFTISSKIGKVIFCAAFVFQGGGVGVERSGLADHVQCHIWHRQIFFKHGCMTTPFRHAMA